MDVHVSFDEVEDVPRRWRSTVADIGRACGDAVEAAVRVGEQTAKQEAPIRSGALRASIHGDVVTRNAAGAVGKVSALAGHAAAVHDGSKPHEIRGNPLAFEAGGAQVFTRRVQHPGTKPNPYMDRTEPVVDATLERVVNSGVDAAMAKFGG